MKTLMIAFPLSGALVVLTGAGLLQLCYISLYEEYPHMDRKVVRRAFRNTLKALLVKSWSGEEFEIGPNAAEAAFFDEVRKITMTAV